MFEKNMRLAFLLDFYGEALDSHTKDILKAYYEDDLSLAEIAEDEGISRQGVRHVIKKGEEQLDFFENALKLAKRNEELLSAATSLEKIKENLIGKETIDFSAEIKAIDSVIAIILGKGV